MIPLPRSTPIRRRVFPGLLLALASAAGSAQTPADDTTRLRVSGFGSFGLLATDAPAGWGFRRDITQAGHREAGAAGVDSRLGLQLNYTATPRLELVAQVVAARQASGSRASDAVEWAFAAFRPNAELALRLGRLNMDAFLMSDYRAVGFGYPMVRPPVDFYGYLPASLDGADLARTWRQGDALWRGKVYVGTAYSGDYAERVRLPVRPVIGLTLSRELDGLLLRAGLTRSSLADNGDRLQPLIDGLAGAAQLPLPNIAAQAQAFKDRLDERGAKVNYAALGFTQDWHDWQWMGEATHVWGHPTAHFSAGYAGLSRRLGSVTLYGLASRIHTLETAAETPDWAATLTPLLGEATARQAQLLAASAAYASNKSLANQSSWSLGARWDLHPRMALKLQWDLIHTARNGGRLWAGSDLAPATARVGSATLDVLY